MAKRNKVFFKDSGYVINRNLVSLPFTRYVPQKKYDSFKMINHLYYKLFNKSHPFFDNAHVGLFNKNDGIWHFFNGVSFSNTPWVTTFETNLPRWNSDNELINKWAIQSLAGTYCKKIIAISECTKLLQIEYLKENYPEYLDDILSKLTVIHPPQERMIEKYSEKNISDKDSITFTIIGSAFFLKGGMEILNVFNQLIKENFPIKLNIISALHYGDYASKTTEKDKEKALKIIKKHPNNISYYNYLPNDKVLEILKKTHIGLLPSYADTYGYSVLEAQACGCPVITTDVRALPEINNEKCGWVIEIPKNSQKKAALSSQIKRNKISEIIEDNLRNIINDIMMDTSVIRTKGIESLNKIKKENNPKDVASKLEAIYDKIN